MNPCPPEPTTTTRSAAPAAPSASRGRILHVDDEPVTSEILCSWLRQNHYDVSHASCPAEADPLFAQHDFDLIISDVHMPGNHRLEWVESLVERGCPAPIMLMTGSPELETACRAANLPVAGYLIKPPDWAALDQKIQTTIAARRRRQDFLALSREILALIETRSGSGSPQEDALIQRLANLSQSFMQQADGAARTGLTGDSPWRLALEDTIAVIEKTKHSFRSKELGQLRARLQNVLTAHRAA